jgi:hypothetical protein
MFNIDQKVNNEINHKEDKKVVNNNSAQNAAAFQLASKIEV